MNFARIAVVQKAALLVVLTSWPESAAASVAQPFFAIHIEIEMLGDSNFPL
jgi:hypothetical protein